MSDITKHYQLLLGLLALQCGFISKDQLIAAFRDWTSNKTRSIEEILIENKVIDSEKRDLLIALVRRHLKRGYREVSQGSKSPRTTQWRTNRRISQSPRAQRALIEPRQAFSSASFLSPRPVREPGIPAASLPEPRQMAVLTASAPVRVGPALSETLERPAQRS